MIRQANKFDIPKIIDMLKNFREVAPIKVLKQADDQEYIKRLLTEIIIGSGFILLAEKNNEIVGMIIGGIIPNLWNPKVKQCSEIAYWVEPDFRGGTTAYRLLKAYFAECDKMMKSGKIQMYTMSKMISSPDLNYQKFGLSKLEETWVK
jgi:N-acetylglutamate synthase-like GNAT family acetyltransferase